MAEDNIAPERDAGKHSQARFLAEKALCTAELGNADEAEALFAEAMQLDPSAVEAAIEAAPRKTAAAIEPAQQDSEIARTTREIRPDAAAPPRAGITDRGSGADSE